MNKNKLNMELVAPGVEEPIEKIIELEIEEIIEKALYNNLDSIESIAIRNDSEKHRNHGHYHQNSHYHITIVSKSFMLLKRIERHRLVLSILNSIIIENNIHSISLSLSIPLETLAKL